MSGARLRVGVLGAGTVGREVVRALLVRPDELRASDGATLELTAVAIRDPGRTDRRRDPAELSRMRRRTSSPTTRSMSSSS